MLKNQQGVSRRKFFPASIVGAGAAALAGNAPAQGRPAQFPVLDTVDVLVAGGGPAGIGAAIGAARAGAKTLLVENHSFFGGVAAWVCADFLATLVSGSCCVTGPAFRRGERLAPPTPPPLKGREDW